MTGEEHNESTEESDPLIGSTVGNYQVTKKIGEGGMGSVYLAEHPLIGKKVAVKVLHAEFSSNQDIITRFFNEAKAVNDIQHPNIVDIIDYGTIPTPKGDMVYFIMEHLDGFPLEDVIEEQSPLDPERCLQICSQVADALAASHQSNIVHRDLKPDNIILIKKRSNSDFVKLLDFGIAKLTGDQPGSSRTRTGIVMGTPAYMSPEQCEGRGMIDERTDVYALGIVLYQMLTGRVPFLGEGYGEILVQHLTQLPTPLHQILDTIPPHVEAICMKALEKKPADRYQNMGDFIAALGNPVGFVESNGGLEGFYQSSLEAPVLPTPMTPVPPPSRALTQEGTSATVAADTHYVSEKPATKSRAPIFIALGLVVAAGVAIAVIMGGSSDSGAKAVATTEASDASTVKAVASVVIDAGVPVDAKVKAVVRTVTAKAVKVSAQVLSKPKGAEVWVDGDFLGVTPMVVSGFTSKDLPLTVTLKSSGFEDFTMPWEFKPKQRKQSYKLKFAKMKKAKRKSGTKTGTGKTDRNTGTDNGTGLMEPGGGSTIKTDKERMGNNTMEPSL